VPCAGVQRFVRQFGILNVPFKESALPLFVLTAIIYRLIHIAAYLNFTRYGLSVLERNEIADNALGFFRPQGIGIDCFNHCPFSNLNFLVEIQIGREDCDSEEKWAQKSPTDFSIGQGCRDILLGEVWYLHLGRGIPIGSTGFGARTDKH
jgi:hypothetical protein